MKRRIALLALNLGITVALVVGCSSEDDLIRPGQDGTRHQLDTQSGPNFDLGSIDLWPNDDGNSWTYRLLVGVSGSRSLHLADSPDEVPLPPPMLDLATYLAAGSPGRVRQLLRLDLPGRPFVGILGTYDMTFRGTQTTVSGVTAQKLEATFVSDFAARSTVTGFLGGFSFWSHLARARPDLKEKVNDLFPTGVPEEQHHTMLFLPTYAWSKRADVIGTHSDFEKDLHWTFLSKRVSAGTRFSLQLVPYLTDDIYLHALVLPPGHQGSVAKKEGAVQIVYMVDYGVALFPQTFASKAGYGRQIDYGTLVFVPDVGPIYGIERLGATTSDPLEDNRFALLWQEEAVSPE